MEENPTPSVQQSNKVLYIMAGIAALFVIGLFTNGFGLFGVKAPNGNIISAPQTEFVPLEVGQSPVLGEASAPVTIYEFSDFSCPYCGAAVGFNQRIIDTLKRSDTSWEAPLPKIKEEYIKTGKVKLIFKYSPGHGAGQAAHRVGWCLNEQNLFWQFHDRAFAQQENTGDTEKMKSLAQELSANMTALNACLVAAKYESLFQKDTQMGRSNGVEGTPSFFINGKLISGAVSYNELKRMVDSEL